MAFKKAKKQKVIEVDVVKEAAEEQAAAPVALDINNPEHGNLVYEELQMLGKGE